MEQSDIDLLETVPAYHLQSLVKTRRLPLASKGQSAGTASATVSSSASSSPTPSSTAKPITGNLAGTAADAQEVASLLFRPAVISEALRSLGPVERWVLRELVSCGGRANSRDLALYMTSRGLPGIGRGGDGQSSYTMLISGGSLYPQPHPHGSFEQALHRLLALGLLFWGRQTNFSGRDYTNGVYDGVLIVPHAVRQVVLDTSEFMEEEVPEAPAFSGRDTGNAQVVEKVSETEEAGDSNDVNEIGEGARALQRMLYLYWSCVIAMRDNGGMRGLALVQSGLLARSSLRQLVEALYPRLHTEQVRAETDIPHLLFLRLLLLKLGLLREQNGVLVARPAQAYFSLPLLERARRCYRLWLETPLWNELLYLPEVALRPTPAPMEPAQAEIMQGHQAIMTRLLHEQPKQWYEVTTFVARAKLYLPNLLFPRQYGPRTERYSMGSNPYGWDFRLRRGWLTPREGWYQVEGGFIRAVLTGPLHWLGLLETKTEEKHTYFRRSSGFALIAGDATPVGVGEQPGRLIVQPNFELVALAPISEALLIGLDRFADRVSLEHVAQYRLTKASVTAAIQHGLRAEGIEQVLEEASGGEIPQNVRYSLVEWERQARRIELWQDMTLLEVDDPQLLDDLFTDETASALLGRRLSPTLAEVVTARLATLQALLWRRDYLPAQSAASRRDDLLEIVPSEPAEPQWRLREDGLLQPLYSVPDLYLAAEMERFTEADEISGWRRITPVSMQRAIGIGLPLSAIIRFLQRTCADGVPASFLIRLKLWSGGYDAPPVIQVEQSPVLYLSAQMLQDLQADEEVGHLLGSALPEEGRVVRVPEEHLARVIALLRERGFTIE